jgi:hypothetical protein
MHERPSGTANKKVGRQIINKGVAGMVELAKMTNDILRYLAVTPVVGRHKSKLY